MVHTRRFSIIVSGTDGSRKKANGEIETQMVLGVSFVPLTGEHEAKMTHKDHPKPPLHQVKKKSEIG